MGFVTRVPALVVISALWACSTQANGGPTAKSGSAGPDDLDADVEDAGTVADPGASDADVALDADTDAGRDTCHVGEGGVSLVSEVAIAPDHGLAVSLSDQGALLSWIAYRARKARLTQHFFTSDGATYELAERDGDSNQAFPASLRVPSGFVSVWSDDWSGEKHLRGLTLSAAGDARSELLADLSSGEDDVRPVLALGADGGALVAYLAKDGARTVLLDAEGSAGPSQALPDGVRPLGTLALAPLGAGFALAYASADDGHVYLVTLDAAGLAASEPTRLDADGSARGNVVMASTDEGGVVAYDVLLGGVWGEVRLRTFDAAGAPTLNERVATVYPEQGAMPAIRPMRGGYALLFRRASEDVQTITLRLVDTRCAPIADMHLLRVESTGLPLALDVSPDGKRMLVAFVDAMAGAPSYALKRAWVVCDD
jgi:hypothetical protein